MARDRDFAKRRVALASIYGSQGRFDEAMRELKRAVEADPEFGDAYYFMGLIYEKRGLLDESAKMYKLATKYESTSPRFRGMAHCNLGAIYMKTGRSDDAEAELKLALKYDPRDAIALYNLGFIYLSRLDLYAAIEKLKLAVKITPDFHKAKRHLEYAKKLLAESGPFLRIFDEMAIRLQRGRLTIDGAVEEIKRFRISKQTVIFLFKEAAKLVHSNPSRAYYFSTIVYETSKIFGDEELQAMCGTALADLLQDMGLFERAIDLYKSALSIEPGHALMGMGLVYVRLGDHEMALQCFKEALAVSEERHDLLNQGIALGNLGHIYYLRAHEGAMDLRNEVWVLGSTRDLGQARSCYEKAMEINERIGNQYGKIISLNGLAFIYRDRGKLVTARKFYEEALKISREIKSVAGEMAQILNLGIVDHLMGDHERAKEEFLQALEIAENIKDVNYSHAACTNLGVLFADDLGDEEQAYSWFKKSIDIIERTRASIVSEEHKTSFLSASIDVYYLIVILCLRMQRFKEAFEYVERGKSRALLDILGNVHVNPRRRADRDLVARADVLRFLINRLSRELENIHAHEEPDMRALTRIEEQILDAELKEIELWNEIRRRNPEYASLRRVETVTLEEVQQMLDEKTAFIEYYTHHGRAIITFLVTRKRFSHMLLDISSVDLWKLILDPLTEAPMEPSKKNMVWLSDVLGQLYKKLFAPFEEKLKELGIERIYFCPHGLLHLLPLHAMYKETEHGPRYVIEDYVVAYTPSASVLRYCVKSETREAESLFAVKNPDGSLEHADEEVDAISRLYEKRIVLDRSNGTRENVLKQAKEYGTIHFACHGQFRGDIPQLSGLKLADGWFTIVDILNNLELNASLVALSACQTAKSRQDGGDEVVGLTRAFLYAGAPSIIASLWSVEDEATSILFQRLHAYLREGDDKAKAIQKAQINTMNFRRKGMIERPFSHPFYWAPFCLIGDWRSPVKVNTSLDANRTQGL